MISKLPRWVWFGGAVLACIAGAINAVGFLSFQHQGVTHLTGTTTLLGVAIARAAWRDALHLLGVIAAFLTGCIFGGFLVQDSTLQLGRRYGIALIIESALLFACVPLLHQGDAVGAYLASCASGLQNGIVSTYSGAVLRTTHVSGLITDLGIAIGQRLRGIPTDFRRVRLYALLLTAFFTGAIAGAFGFASLSYATLYVPAALTGCVGLAYSAYAHRRHQTA